MWPGEPCAELKQLKEQFVVSTVFFKKWEQSFNSLFPDGFVGGVKDEDDARTLKRLSFEIGWLVFLLARVQAKRGDIVSLFPLLVSVIHLLLAHIPAAAKLARFWQELETEVPAECYPFPTHALSELCNQHKLQRSDLQAKAEEMMAVERILQRVLSLTTRTAALTASDGGGGGFRGMLQQKTLRATHEALNREYDQVWPQRSQLDGRFFFAEQAPARRSVPPSVPASPNLLQRGVSSAPMLTPQRHANPLCGRATGGVPQTPISSQLESKQWLAEAVACLQAQPSNELLEFFAACQVNPAEAICQRLQARCWRVSQHFSEIMEASGEVEELLLFTRKLYYKMLVVFLQAEQQRLNVNDFGKLLSNDAFHCSLLACCVEAIIAAKSVDEVAFPAVLELLDLHAFDFCKVIESFIKAEPRLPGHLRSHFADVETNILESLAWADQSPLHELIREYDVAGDGPGEGKQGPARAKVAFEQFIKKVWYLAAVRIQEICLRLLLPSFIVQQVWDCIKLVLKKARHLLTGRHLDQIVMCTVYGVCKVNQRSVTFRHIIEQYKWQPKASPKVFREVRMASDCEKPQDIICFYNQIYIPAMKEHLMHIVSTPSAAKGAGSTDGPPALPSLTRLTRGGASPQRVSVQRDVYVSQPRAPSSMTPRTKTLYSFGDTPAAKLQTINSQLKSTGSDGAAMHALHQMRSSTSQHGMFAGQANEDEASESVGRKRSLDLSQDPKGSSGRRIMQRRLDQLGSNGADRSSTSQCSPSQGEDSDGGDNSAQCQASLREDT